VKIQDLNERLKDSILIADGAMGSMLHEAVGAQRCFDELNSTEPEAVFRVHQAYIEAGAHIIETIVWREPIQACATRPSRGSPAQQRGVNRSRSARVRCARSLDCRLHRPLGLGVQSRTCCRKRFRIFFTSKRCA